MQSRQVKSHMHESYETIDVAAHMGAEPCMYTDTGLDWYYVNETIEL